MSRMLKQFEKNGLIDKTPSDTDSRIKYIRFTDFGREEFNRLSDIPDANDVITIRPFRQSDIE